MQAVIDAAEELDCPVVLHIEFVSLATNYGESVRSEYMEGLKMRLSANPDRAFVLTHVAEVYPDECRGLIEVYSNVYLTTNFDDLDCLMTGNPANDYDGDGVCDFAVYDPQNCLWYIMSLEQQLIAWATQWGWTGAETVGQ